VKEINVAITGRTVDGRSVALKRLRGLRTKAQQSQRGCFGVARVFLLSCAQLQDRCDPMPLIEEGASAEPFRACNGKKLCLLPFLQPLQVAQTFGDISLGVYDHLVVCLQHRLGMSRTWCRDSFHARAKMVGAIHGCQSLR